MTKTTSRLLAIVLVGLLAAAMLCLYALEAAAFEGRGQGSGGTEIEIENESCMDNDVTVVANTGANTAIGGRGGDGDDGGDASQGTAGRGGNGGDGGDSGNINTAPATAYGTIINDVNNTRVVVERESDAVMPYRMSMFHYNKDTGELEIEIENESRMHNDVTALANTGLNVTRGGSGGDGDDGGDAMSRHSHRSWNMWYFFMNPSNTGGAGGNGGAGGDSGNINTAPAYADGYIENQVNHEVVRVRAAERPTPPSMPN